MTLSSQATAIVQARMGSSRLPGKVLLEVLGKPLLAYEIERIRKARQIDRIVVATTTNSADDPVADLCAKMDVDCFRGEEHDVLDRYYQAARRYRASTIVRLTGDCPLVDPEICDRLVTCFSTSGRAVVRTGPTFAEGMDCEVFSFQQLAAAWRDAHRCSEREHCTLYFYNHPEKFPCKVVESATDDSRYRLTVDRPEDFHVVAAVITALHTTAAGVGSIAQIKAWLDQHPEVTILNRDVARNEGLLRSLAAETSVDCIAGGK